MRTPEITWSAFKSFESSFVAPPFTATAKIRASQKPIFDASSIRNAADTSVYAISRHQPNTRLRPYVKTSLTMASQFFAAQ